MGWLINSAPRDPKEYLTQVIPPSKGQRAMVLHTDQLSTAVSGLAFAGENQPVDFMWKVDPDGRNRSAAIGQMNVTLRPGEQMELALVASMAHNGVTIDEMAERLDYYGQHFDEAWKDAKFKWEEFWNDAFTSPELRTSSSSTSLPIEHQLSGHVPILTTNDTAIKRIYYMGILSLLCTNRASLPAFGSASSYITAHGKLAASHHHHCHPQSSHPSISRVR
jgi:hypothetical protein